jgi:pyruvate dehydrogenase E1 component alpha subunit/2-oxoisovalerate dehydrogenase E1 component alpha subunit
VSEAINRARTGGGPQLVVANLLRLCGHGEHDDAGYVDPALKSSPAGRDCLKLAESYLTDRGLVTPADLDRWRAAATETVEQAVARVQREPAPDAGEEDWCAISTRQLQEGKFQ